MSLSGCEGTCNKYCKHGFFSRHTAVVGMIAVVQRGSYREVLYSSKGGMKRVMLATRQFLYPV